MTLWVTGRKPRSFFDLPILMGIILLALFTAGCSVGEAGRAGDAAPPSGVVRLLNWSDYTDPSVIADFEAETGMRIELTEYDTSDEMIALVQSNPLDYDVIVLDGDLIQHMLELRAIREIDRERIPNSQGLLEPFSRIPIYDKDGKYSIPYQWGSTGLVFNAAFVPLETGSWEAMWDPRYQGRVGLLDDMREALLPVMLKEGMPVNTTDPASLEVVAGEAMKLAGNGVVFGNTYDLIDKVMKGELWIAEAYGGDVEYMAGGREDIRFVLPDEGFGVWLESFVVSSNVRNEAGAYALIDFFCRPDISARSASTFFYGSPIAGAEELLDSRSAALPDAADFVHGQPYIDLGQSERNYRRIFSEMKLQAGEDGVDGT